MKNMLIETADQVLAPTYKRYPLVIVRGRGCTLWDVQGKSYVDFVAGIAVCSLGHVHPAVVRALKAQADILWHVSNLYYTQPQVDLAAKLTQNCFAERVFFCNSGAEANEAAIKLARKYFKDHGQPQRYRIMAMEQSFHGRTMATLSATGQDKIKQGFEPLLEGFDFVPFNDAKAIQKAIDPETCAVMLEPIQGEGGVCVPGDDYLPRVREICNQAGVLLIYDEIQCGMGRTGRLFAYEHWRAAPDIMTLAKALANGLPMGAMLASAQVMESFGAGSHATTFGGTPLVAAAALATLEAFENENVVTRCAETGKYFRKRLEWLAARHDCALEVRGRGLLLGLRLDQDAADVVDACMQGGFLINCVQSNILRFAPPLIIKKAHIDALIDCLDEVLRAMQ